MQSVRRSPDPRSLSCLSNIEQGFIPGWVLDLPSLALFLCQAEEALMREVKILLIYLFIANEEPTSARCGPRYKHGTRCNPTKWKGCGLPATHAKIAGYPKGLSGAICS
ncbi:hypothetical protein PAXRUDRAFT_834417 [Paxillus rubicundulus Ve08.2h10]|uniref:Uncharacterized protein n=1 Tax=Paxillus rubicundulus Ve08.2h10 TaxID=930991 RepID=A0A0D0DKT6_9AGAM|nr:hypothetical protein PAXRUDRAFT_834417 [Paxillus rubicundulus Ve08.2h10]